MHCSPPAPLSMAFSRQEHWSGLSCPPPGEFTNLWIEPESLCLLHWQVDSFPLATPGAPRYSKAINYAVKKMAEDLFTFCTKENILHVFSAKKPVFSVYRSRERHCTGDFLKHTYLYKNHIWIIKFILYMSGSVLEKLKAKTGEMWLLTFMQLNIWALSNCRYWGVSGPAHGGYSLTYMRKKFGLRFWSQFLTQNQMAKAYVLDQD